MGYDGCIRSGAGRGEHDCAARSASGLDLTGRPTPREVTECFLLSNRSGSREGLTAIDGLAR